MKLYKLRAIIFIYITRLLSKVMCVEVPPVVSVGAIIERNGDMLFLELSYLNGLGLPGGLVKDNEDIEAALKREIMEETGLNIANLQYLYSIPSSFKQIPTICIFFKVETEGETKDSIEGKLVWMKAETAISKMAYENAKLGLTRYLNK